MSDLVWQGISLVLIVVFFAHHALTSSRRRRQQRDAAEFASIGQRDPRPLKGAVPYLQDQAVHAKAAALVRERRRTRLAARRVTPAKRKTALPFTRKAGAA